VQVSARYSYTPFGGKKLFTSPADPENAVFDARYRVRRSEPERYPRIRKRPSPARCRKRTGADRTRLGAAGENTDEREHADQDHRIVHAGFGGFCRGSKKQEIKTWTTRAASWSIRTDAWKQEKADHKRPSHRAKDVRQVDIADPPARQERVIDGEPVQNWQPASLDQTCRKDH